MGMEDKIRIRLRRETEDRKPLPLPDKYPDEFVLPETPQGELTHRMVRTALMAELKNRGVEPQNVNLVYKLLFPDLPENYIIH